MPQDNFKQSATSTLDLATAPQEIIDRISEIISYEGKITIGYHNDSEGLDTTSETLEAAIATLKERGKTFVAFTKEEAPDYGDGGIAINPSHIGEGFEDTHIGEKTTYLSRSNNPAVLFVNLIQLPIETILERLGDRDLIALPVISEVTRRLEPKIFRASRITAFSLDPDEKGFLSVSFPGKIDGGILDYAIVDTPEARQTMTEELKPLLPPPANQQEPVEQ